MSASDFLSGAITKKYLANAASTYFGMDPDTPKKACCDNELTKTPLCDTDVTKAECDACQTQLHCDTEVTDKACDTQVTNTGLATNKDACPSVV